MTTALRLFTIEARRSAALWFAPALAALVVWGTLATMRPDDSPTLWARSGTQFGLMCVVAAFIMCGVGAWTAGRDQRRQIGDLTATMPSPVPVRDVTLLASTVAWGLLACLAAGAIVFAVTSREATWGGPPSAPVGIGLLTVVTGTATGYLGGTLFPSRFAAPLAAVVFSAVLLLVGTRSSAIAFLSPMSLDPRGSSPYDVFYRPPAIPALQMSLWLTGLAGCALAAVVLSRRRTLLAASLLAVAFVVATSGAILVTQAFVHPPWERIYPGQPLAAYQPACVEHSIPICVHPAYETHLDDVAVRIDTLVEPLVGVAGGPVRAEQLPERAGLRSDGTLELLPGPFVVVRAAYDLVVGRDSDLTQPQRVIAFWLMSRVGEQADGAQSFFGSGQPDAEVRAAVARFAALSPEVQHAWLEANYADLRAGKLTMADLP